LDIRLLDSSLISIEQSRFEILRMAKIDGEMLTILKRIITNGEARKDEVGKIFESEEMLDTMQKEVVVFLTHILTTEITSDYAKEVHLQLRHADEYESVSDYCAAILKMCLRLKNAGLSFDDEEIRDLSTMHDLVYNYYMMIYEAHQKRNASVIIRAQSESDVITQQFREMRSRHLDKLSKKHLDPLICTIYPDMLTGYRRIKDHLLNIAEAIAGVK
jgi:phosphate:Na+ symporter